jgi:hypothetical protein
MMNSLELHIGISFRVEFLLAGIAFNNLLRMLIMLELTKPFGPFITIIKKMLGDLLVFLILWVTVLMAFSGGAFIYFRELTAFKS